MRRPTLATVFFLSLGTAACIPPAAERNTSPTPPPPTPVVRPAPVPPPAPLAEDWRDWPLATGTWRYDRVGGGQAVFGAGVGAARLTLRCDRAAQQIVLSHAGAATGPLTVRTSTIARSLAVTPEAGGTSVRAALPVRDPLLDAIAFSRGRFVIQQAGAAPLVMPTYAEIGRVIEDCRG